MVVAVCGPSCPSRGRHPLPAPILTCFVLFCPQPPPSAPTVSPMQDPTLESMLAGSTPRHFTLAGGLPSPRALLGGLPAAPGGGGGTGGGTLVQASSTTSTYSTAAPPMLTFPSVASGELSGGGDEGDEMPFALDEGSASPLLKLRSPSAPAAPAMAPPAATEQLPVSSVAASAGGPSAAAMAAVAPSPAAAAAAAPAVVDTDAAVGAFVRLIQEAPPLRLHNSRPPTRAASADLAAMRLAAAAPGTSSGSDSSGATCLSDGRGLTLQAGLRQFSKIRERLQARGVVLGPLPAEA